jgi:hypothetical protein
MANVAHAMVQRWTGFTSSNFSIRRCLPLSETSSIYMSNNIEALVLPLVINPNEKINRILRMIERVKQNGLYISCRGRITRDHVVVSSGRPRHYYHKYCAMKHHII